MKIFDAIDASIAISQNGWCTREKARVLAMLVMALKPEVSVEIGVYSGKSAIAIALAHKHNKKGQLIAIDPWSVDASIEGYDAVNADWWKKVPHEEIYKEFVENIIKFQVSPYIEIKKAKSNDVEPPDKIGLIHVDGQHSLQAVTDVERFAPKVIKGGVVVMDDTGWHNQGEFQVQKAVDKLLELGFVELFKLGTGAVFQKL